MPIPLLRLPLLVLDEVIKNVAFRQLLTLSLCSKRMHWVVKNLRDKSIELMLELIDNVSISVCGKTDVINCYLFEKNSRRRLLLFDMYPMPKRHVEGWRDDRCRGGVFQEDIDGFSSYWEDGEEGARWLVEHISDLFGVQVETVILCNDSLWILDVVEERQGPRSYNAEIKSYGIPDDQLRHLLVDLNPTSLSISVPRCDTFRIENFQKTYEELRLSWGNWITGENLLTLDCSRLSIAVKKFTVAEMNRFLRHVLVDGGAPRLTEFDALVEHCEANSILEGIRKVLTPIPGEKQFQNNGWKWEFVGMMNRGNQSERVVITCYESTLITLTFKE